MQIVGGPEECTLKFKKVAQFEFFWTHIFELTMDLFQKLQWKKRAGVSIGMTHMCSLQARHSAEMFPLPHTADFVTRETAKFLINSKLLELRHSFGANPLILVMFYSKRFFKFKFRFLSKGRMRKRRPRSNFCIIQTKSKVVFAPFVAL